MDKREKFIIPEIVDESTLKKQKEENKEEIKYYDKNQTEEKKKLTDEEKYDPNRIPSWLRREEDSGINRAAISDLLGIKDEARLERERQEYGQRYRDAFSGVTRDNTKTIPDAQIIDPLNVKKKEQEEQNKKEVINQEEVKETIVQETKVQETIVKETIVPETKETIVQETNDYEEPIDDDYLDEDDEDFEEESYEEEEETPIQDEEYKEVSNPVRRTQEFTQQPKELERQREGRREKEVVEEKVEIKFGDTKKKYRRPPLEILRHSNGASQVDNNSINYQIGIINRTLSDFKIGGKVINYTRGPAVTQFEIKLDPGVNVSRISQITRNLQMNLESESLRIECPIPGKSTIGVEVPNIDTDMVLFGDLASDEKFLNDGKPLNVILGLSIDGKPIYTNIGDMPHALIAGQTGSGKTVVIYSMIASILYKASPEEVKLILIDPKRNEFIYFEDIPHLATPIIDESKLAVASLQWAVDEMDRRYDFLKANRKRTIVDYNEYAKENGLKVIPYIIIVVDEFADLMSVASETFETNIQRITQKARSAGIHLLIATQRPSTDVIKGTIKANIPTRIALQVKSQVDSMTVLDHGGAEKLLGKGDMLYTKGSHDIRIQGSFITSHELDDLSTYFYEQDITPNYIFDHDVLQKVLDSENSSSTAIDGDADMEDELLEEVAHFIFFNHKASANQITQTYKISFNRANRMINALAKLGIVSSENIPGRARPLLVDDIDTLEQILNDR